MSWGRARLDIVALSGGRPSLVAYSDPEGTSLFVGDDGLVSVAVDGAATATRLPLAGVLHSWLSGGEHFGLVLRPTGGTRASRWDALRGALGTLVPLSVNGEGERRQDKVFVEDAELWLTYDTIKERSGLEQLNLQHYLDRLDDVKRLLTPALAAAGLELVRAEGPRGVVPW